nr:660_t:CDS:2 [Entrophospora candida]
MGKTYNQIDTKKNNRWETYIKKLTLLAIVTILWNLLYYLSSYNYLFNNNIEDSSSQIKHISSSKILQDCNNDCKFLFPYFIAEQETKSNLHIRTFVQLAESLNRILVLPNVGSSRSRACLPFSPSFYYNLNSLHEMFPNAKFIVQKEYDFWLEDQSDYKNIIGEHILLKSTLDLAEGGYEELKQPLHRQNKFYNSFSIAKNSSNPYYINQLETMDSKCHYDLKTNVTKFKEIRILKNGFLNHSPKQRKKFSKFLIEDLKSDSQILFIYSELQQAAFPDLYKPIPYADHIVNEAWKIINQLDSSYIAIHWRMEQAAPKNLPSCARELVKTIQKIKENTGINNVYLATDFPLTYNRNGSISITSNALDIKPQSDTFEVITIHHIKAMEILTSSVNIKTWQSLNAFEYLKYIGQEEDKENLLIGELQGPGVQGILDKIVCINSNYFLSGPRSCCRIQSTYTKILYQNMITYMEGLDRNTGQKETYVQENLSGEAEFDMEVPKEIKPKVTPCYSQLDCCFEINSNAVREVGKEVEKLGICLKHLNLDQNKFHQPVEGESYIKATQPFYNVPCHGLHDCQAIIEHPILASIPENTQCVQYVCTDCLVLNGAHLHVKPDRKKHEEDSTSSLRLIARWINNVASSNNNDTKNNLLNLLINKVIGDFNTTETKATLPSSSTVIGSSDNLLIPSFFHLNIDLAVKNINMNEDEKNKNKLPLEEPESLDEIYEAIPKNLTSFFNNVQENLSGEAEFDMEVPKDIHL